MSKKLMIIVGTRPNFIKITQFEKELSLYSKELELVLVHTNQHYDESMSAVFFEQFQLKQPEFIGIKGGSNTDQIGNMIIALGKAIDKHQPDAIMVVGDVNSTLAGAITANKTNTLLFHLESGLRSFDKNMPEEINRIITDTLSDYFFVTEQSGLNHLLNEGKNQEQIYFVGNTMIDSLVCYEKEIEASPILEKLNIKPKQFVLMTMHRPSNVDTKENLLTLINIIKKIAENNYLVFPIHHRTKNNLERFGLYEELTENNKVLITNSLDYFSFQKLIAHCRYVLTDSGGIQEETTFRNIPCLTLRENTERPSTINIGTNELVALDYNLIAKKIHAIENGTFKKGNIPPLWDGNATKRVIEFIYKILYKKN